MMRNGARSQQYLLYILSIALSVAFPSVAFAEPVPANLQGSWSRNCKDLGANSVNIDSAAVTVVVKGKRHVYKGIDISRTWFGGAKATGDTIWLLMGKEDGKEFEFIIAATPGKKGFLVLEEGNPERGREIRPMFGQKLRNCASQAASKGIVENTKKPKRDPWIGKWGGPSCKTGGTVISFSKTVLDMSSLELMCKILSVKNSGSTYSFELHCDSGYKTTMHAKVEGDVLEFVKQKPGFEFDPKRFRRC